MNPSILAALFASSVALTSTHVEAQAPDALLGKWTIEFERGRRMENGEATIMMGTGKVTITQSGDSLLPPLTWARAQMAPARHRPQSAGG
jgi:hypothetical protein